MQINGFLNLDGVGFEKFAVLRVSRRSIQHGDE
jgi:hypothetical protein